MGVLKKAKLCGKKTGECSPGTRGEVKYPGTQGNPGKWWNCCNKSKDRSDKTAFLKGWVLLFMNYTSINLTFRTNEGFYPSDILSRTAVPNLFGTRDWFHEDNFSTNGSGAEGLRKIQAHHIYRALYFYYYYISSTSDHQALDPRGWGPLITGEEPWA